MITLDLFEQTDPQEPKRDPVQDPRMAMDTKTRQLALLMYNQMIKAYKSGVPIATLEYPDPATSAVTLSRNQLYTFLLHWANAQQRGGKRKEDFIKLFGNRSAMLDYIGRIKKIEKAPAPEAIPTPTGVLPGEEGPVQAVQGRLFKEEEKKSSEQSKYKDVAVQRAIRQAQADFPTAATDTEAFIKSMMVQQDQDQRNIDRLKSSYQRNRELINKNSQLDQSQEQNISAIQQEIDQVEQDNNNLSRMVQSMARANAELKSTLDKMRQRSPEPVATTTTVAPQVQPQTQLGVSVATDKIQQPQLPQPEPKRRVRRKSTPIGSTKVGGQDAEILSPRGGGRAPQKQAIRVDQEQPQLDLGKSDINVDRILSQQDIDDLGDFDFDIMGMLKGNKQKEKVGEVHDIAFGMTEDQSIPPKAVIQGYTVEYDPVRRTVSVSRRGQLVGRALNKPGSHNNYMTLVNRIIDASEEDKYPDDLEARSVERPFGESTEELTAQDILFRTAAKAMYDANQQGVDLDFEEAIRIASRLMRIPYAPSMIPALQAQLDDVKKKIATMKSVRKSQRQREREKLTHQTTADEEQRRQQWMKNYGDSLRRRLQTRQTESEQKKHSAAWEQGGREGYYGRPKNNPYEKGTAEYADWNRGYDHFKDDGKDYLRELDLDRSGQPMYQQQEVYMLAHNGREVAFYKLKDLKRAEQDAREMQRKLGGEVHIRKVMREADQKPADDDIMKQLFKDFGEIFGKQPPQPKPQEPEKKDVKEGDVVKVDFRQGADAEAVRTFKEKRAAYFDKIAKADPETAKRLRAELQDLEDAARRRGLIREGRAGYGPLLNQKHWEEVEKHLWNMMNNRSLDDETRAAYKQRYLEKQREAQLKGFKE